MLYKRHTDAKCAVHRLNLPVEQKKSYFDCECYFYLVGFLPNGDYVDRAITGTSNKREAEAKQEALIRAALDHEVKADTGPSIPAVIDKYLKDCESRMGPRVLRTHERILSQLQTFCYERNVYYSRDLNADLLIDFRSSLTGIAETTKSTYFAKVRAFLKQAFKRGWITESLREKVDGIKAIYEQKKPFEDEELALLWAEASRLKGGIDGYASQPQTFILLMDLMLETGMRCGDAVRYNPKEVQPGDELGNHIYTFEMQKKKVTDPPAIVEAHISEKLKTAIDKCTWLSKDLPFYYMGPDAKPHAQAGAVYERMQNIGERCDVEDCRPHRLRDTFAVRLLTEGVQLDDVSRLLGHKSVTVTERHYAKWVRSRRRRLERVLAETRKQRLVT
jgi:integrase/recombinase XerD